MRLFSEEKAPACGQALCNVETAYSAASGGGVSRSLRVMPSASVIFRALETRQSPRFSKSSMVRFGMPVSSDIFGTLIFARFRYSLIYKNILKTSLYEQIHSADYSEYQNGAKCKRDKKLTAKFNYIFHILLTSFLKRGIILITPEGGCG
jgi:hypothetical protein